MAELTEAATAATTEAVAEVAEEVAGQAMNIAEVSRGITTHDMAFIVGGLCMGFGIGYFFAKRRLETKYNKLAEEEIDTMREHFRAKEVAREEKPRLTDVSKQSQALANLKEGKKNAQQPEQKTPEPKVMEEDDDGESEAVDPQSVEFPDGYIPNEHETPGGWSYKKELAHRQRFPDKPHIIHLDELGERDYTKASYTYYMADDIMADEQNRILEDVEGVIGMKNLRFGYGSGDPNIVYIRNDYLAMEMEVVRERGSFSEIVHGIKHSDPSRRRKPRWDDE
jgi:hypothetical protein